MALFYNKADFDKFGVAVPTTWDEYLDAARALHAADPNAYIAADTGDAGFTTSHDLGGRRPPVPRRTAPTSPSTWPTRAPSSSPTSGTS